ncbi:MAG: hypothetical protein ABL888_00565 [Pirellulaceae bacterium]
MRTNRPSEYDLPTQLVEFLSRAQRLLRWHFAVVLLARFLTIVITAFVVSWLLDYCPIWFGGFESPTWVRVILLLAIGFITLPPLFRGLNVLLGRQVNDARIALLIEAKVPAIRNGLSTLLDYRNFDAPLSENSRLMLSKTESQVLSALQGFDLRSLFDHRHKATWVAASAIAVLTTGALAFLFPSPFQLAGQRLFLLDSTRYLRRFEVQLLGARSRHEKIVDDLPELNRVRPFDENKILHVARGDSLTVLAEGRVIDSAEDQTLSCELSYRTSTGLSGRVLLKKVGRTNKQAQLFELDGPPFDKLADDIRFSLRCGDYSSETFLVRVVEAPAVVSTELDCRFPDYMVDPVSLRWTPRTMPWNVGTKLPEGTRVKVRCGTTTELAKVYVATSDNLGDTQSSQLQEILPTEKRFEFSIDSLSQNFQSRIYLVDQNGVATSEPFGFSLEAIADRPPKIATKLKGVGLSVTPQAQLPLVGNVDDDYGVNQVWVELDLPQNRSLREPVPSSQSGDIQSVIDLRTLKETDSTLPLDAGSDRSLSVVVKANDRFNLKAEPNQATGDKFELDLVTSNDLLRILERHESAERRRLEKIYDELFAARDYLERISGQATGQNSGTKEPGDIPKAEPGEPNSLTDLDKQRLQRENRAIYSGRFRTQLEKSAAEIWGTAEAFDNLRLQLINNRLNAVERENRLASQVVAPLNKITSDLRGSLKDRARKIQTTLQSHPLDAPVSEEVEERVLAESSAAADELKETLDELQKVISILVKFETQNELLDIVRAILKTQTELHRRTQEQRKKDAFEGLID